MWAKNENGTPKRYVNLPENYKNYIGFNRMSSTIHEQEGFFLLNVPQPGIHYSQDLQERGDIIWDEVNNWYTYQINDKVIDVEAEKQKHYAVLSAVIDEISGIVSAVKNVYDPLRDTPENIPEDFKTLVRQVQPLRAVAISEIEALSTPEEAVTYVVRGPQVQGYIELLKSFK